MLLPIPPRTQALLTRMDQGFDPNFLFFWGHRPAGSAVDKSCLSQWFEGAPFVIDGIRYATAEHFMMAEKARLFDDKNTLAKILKAPSADAAKKLGRQVQGFDGKRWDARGFDAVVEGNVAKFSQHAGRFAGLLGQQHGEVGGQIAVSLILGVVYLNARLNLLRQMARGNQCLHRLFKQLLNMLFHLFHPTSLATKRPRRRHLEVANFTRNGVS